MRKFIAIFFFLASAVTAHAGGALTVMQSVQATNMSLRYQAAQSVIQRPSISQAQRFAQMLTPIPMDTAHLSTPYTGPCDVTLSSPCVEAYSTARAMTSSYAGPLFQVYDGTSTTDITQTNHLANTALLLSACANKTTCVVSKVYANIGGSTNDLRPALTTDGGATVAACSSTYACAPPIIIDPANGLPVITTPYPTALYNSTTGTTFSGGANPVSVFAYTNIAGTSQCCGFFGIAHAASGALTAGTDFLPGLTYGNGHTFSNCSTSTAVCAMIDIETYMDNGADTTFTLNNIKYMATAAGGAGNINVYVDSATPIYTGAPSHATTLNVGKYPRIGGGGDMTHVNSVFQEGYIANAAWSATDFTNLSGNVSTFYGARSKDACSGTADLSYHFEAPFGIGGALANGGPLSTLLAYGLRRLRASYYGPIATLRRASDNAEQTFGPATSGCGIDSAAATFCNATTCFVKTAFNQGTLSLNNVGNVHDSTLDVTQATAAQQPSVNFTGLNGYPTMVFSGASSQYLCAASPTGAQSTRITAVGWVAKRTSFTTYSAIFNVGGSDQSVGFNNVSGEIYGNIGVFIHGGAFTEGHWHSSVNEQLNTSANGVTVYGDNTSVIQGTAATFHAIAQGSPICVGVDDSAGTKQYYLTGEIAEVMALGQGAPSGAATTQRSAIFTAQQSSWGTLPN